jgi:hypothetical protein
LSYQGQSRRQQQQQAKGEDDEDGDDGGKDGFLTNEQREHLDKFGPNPEIVGEIVFDKLTETPDFLLGIVPGKWKSLLTDMKGLKRDRQEQKQQQAKRRQSKEEELTARKLAFQQKHGTSSSNNNNNSDSGSSNNNSNPTGSDGQT